MLQVRIFKETIAFDEATGEDLRRVEGVQSNDVRRCNTANAYRVGSVR